MSQRALERLRDDLRAVIATAQATLATVDALLLKQARPRTRVAPTIEAEASDLDIARARREAARRGWPVPPRRAG